MSCTMYILLTLAHPIDCEWSEWEIGSCSKPCGGGYRINTRTKKVNEANGGKCDGLTTKQEDCNMQVCGGKLYIIH